MKQLPSFFGGALLLMGLATLAAHSATPTSSTGPKQEAIVQASFNRDGSVNIPVGYRQWVHVGTRVKLDGINILDGKVPPTPEMFDTYVEPSAFMAYQKTGQWPEGAQLVKEFSAIRIGDGCDQTTRNCKTPFGGGIFQAGYVGLGMMVKNTKRFPDVPGNWGYFEFGHKPLPYDATSMERPAAQCSGCHVAVAADTDYVVSLSHIGLARGDQ